MWPSITSRKEEEERKRGREDREDTARTLKRPRVEEYSAGSRTLLVEEDLDSSASLVLQEKNCSSRDVELEATQHGARA